ncbi:MAG: hypothetical protein DMF23_08025 [Verrucomicrobia bacterium]|nr:MAG: hypothetical protein DMF23_08025 [Verrucomicrobiota bacterium]
MNGGKVRRWGQKTANAQRRTSNPELPRFKDVTIQCFNAATRSAASGREIATFDGMHFSVLTAMASQSNSWPQWTLWAVVMSLVMGWVARSRMRPRPACCDQQLRHPVSTLIIGLAGFLLFAAIAVISNVFSNKTTSWWTTAIFLGFALLALPVVCWDELSSVRFSSSMKWFRLETQSGTVVRVSVMLMGLPVFAQMVLAYARSAAIDPTTQMILHATAEGNPPSVWGLSEGPSRTNVE